MESILVTGGTGLVGKHLQKFLPEATYLSRAYGNLKNIRDVYDIFEQYKPTRVIHLAAKVGGIQDNINHPVEFLNINLLMDQNVLKACHVFEVPRVTACLSSCIYPDVVGEYPMIESDIFKGPPPTSNFSYAMAKRVLHTQIGSYNTEYGYKWNWVAPCNLFGEFDNFNDDHSHFIASLLKKIYFAGADITLFGNGTPLRQFMYAGDLAKVFVSMIKKDITASFNVAPDYNYTIEEMASHVINTCKPGLQINWDITKPNGQYRKDISNKKLKKYLPRVTFTSFTDGIRQTYGRFTA